MVVSGVRLKQSPDHFIDHPSELKGQPKRTIAEYVEGNGILVPQRFGSIEDARKSGLSIIARSEHAQDYDGASGLVISPMLKDYPDIKTENEIKLRIFDPVVSADYGFYHPGIFESYCRLLGKGLQQFEYETTFSYWEHLDGIGRKVIADSSVPGRYHITAERIQEGGTILSYVIFENGKSTQLLGSLPKDLLDGLRGLVDIYEKVRNLEKFDPNHCPIMEFVTFQGKDYFLQYHRGRDYEASGFSLDRKPTKGEIKAPFVRGATSPDGMNYKVTVRYGWEYGSSPLVLPKKEDGSFDSHYSTAFSEIMTRRRKLQMISQGSSLEHKLRKMVVAHDNYSTLMKPRVSVIQKIGGLVSNEEYEVLNKKAFDGAPSAAIDVHVVSDGRIAYLKRV